MRFAYYTLRHIHALYANRLQAPSRVIQRHDGETVLHSASVEDDLLIKIKAD